jgi:hypothetical protein
LIHVLNILVTAPDYEGFLRFPVYILQCSLTYSVVVPNKKCFWHSVWGFRGDFLLSPKAVNLSCFSQQFVNCWKIRAICKSNTLYFAEFYMYKVWRFLGFILTFSMITQTIYRGTSNNRKFNMKTRIFLKMDLVKKV